MPRSVSREQFHTVQAVPLTGFDENDRLNLEPMRRNTRRLYEAGIRCFIPCAGSSEFHSLSVDEIAQSIAMTRKELGDNAVIMAPVGMQIGQAIECGRKSVEAGADAILIMPLIHPYQCDAGARDYFRAILDAVDCPAMIYKKDAVPGDNLLLAMADHPRVIGVKYAVNDIDAFNRVIRDDGGRTDWYCGSAERFAPFFMVAGAPGYTSGAANICPKVTVAMHAAAVAGDWGEAFRLQQIIRPIEEYRAKANSSYNISFLKHAATHVGLDFGPPRPPQRRLTEAEKREIDAIVPSILEAEAAILDATAAAS